METALSSAATAHALGLVRHGRLTARGAPASLDTLNGDWERCPRSPYVEERPHYVKRGANAKGAAFEMHLFYSHGHWYVTPSATHGGVVLCGARSDSLSPTTVDAKQWHQPTAAGGAAPMPEFEFTCDGPNTEDEPFLMEARHRPAPKPKTTYPSRLLVAVPRPPPFPPPPRASVGRLPFTPFPAGARA